MFTIEQIAAEINKSKPDFSKFLECLLDPNKYIEKAIADIDNTSSIYEKLLKTEIAFMYCYNHNRRYSSKIQAYAIELFSKHITNCTLTKVSGSSPYYRYTTHNYSIVDSFLSEFHIMAHITDQKAYLPKYLWNKVCAKKILAVKSPKQLQPNGLVLEVFRQHVSTLKKPMTTSVIIDYLTQFYPPEFANFRTAYMDIIFGNCPSPSVIVQKLLVDGWQSSHRVMQLPTQSSQEVTKYMHLRRQQIRNLARELSIPVSGNIYDTRDSEYKPFITGLQRVPEKRAYEISYLFDALMVLQISVSKTPNPVHSYFIEELTKFLSHPQHKPVIDELKQNLSQITQIMPTLAI